MPTNVCTCRAFEGRYDEATSALDMEAEVATQQSLAEWSAV
ncbi:hypothetical protein [Paenibacillus polymyxa]